MKTVVVLLVVLTVLLIVLPTLQAYMRMLIEEHDDMEKLS